MTRRGSDQGGPLRAGLSRYWRAALASAGGVVLVVLGTLGLAHLYRQSHEGLNWQAATQTVLTIVLVGVTAWYARLTARMVDIQAHPEHQVRIAAQHAALGEAVEFLTIEQSAKVGHIADAFPIEDATTLQSIAELDGSIFQTLSAGLGPIGVRLPPPTSDACETLVSHLRSAGMHLLAVQVSISAEQMRARTESREPTWSGVRSDYDARFYAGRMKDYEGRLTWDEIASGRPFGRANNSLMMFSIVLRFAMQG